jgi:hypothetical protein
MSLKIQDWFDPYDIDHVIAYKHLTQEGIWPAGFVPGYVTFNSGWVVAILGKLADAWVKHRIPSYYVVFPDEHGMLKCVTVEAEAPILAEDKVKKAYGGWVPTLVFREQPWRGPVYTIVDGKIV